MDRIDEPQNERSRRTRQAILDAVWELLEERGADQLSMASIAQKAGVSRRAIYLHFASRGELLIALHSHIDEALDLDASLRPIREAPDAARALDEFAAHLARYHPQFVKIELALDQARRSDPDVAALWEHGSRIWHEGCLELTAWLEREDRLAEPWTIETAADLLWTFMTAHVIEHLTTNRGWSHDEYAQRLAIILRRTLVRPASGEGECNDRHRP